MTPTLHFLHIGKTGGTAIKRALWRARLAYWLEENSHRAPETPYGRIKLHKHSFGLRDVPADDYVFFCVRDPIARFFSGFNSRRNKGQPTYYFEWSPAEKNAFEAFPTAHALAASLASDDKDERRLAEWAMSHIRHLGPMGRRLGSPRQVRSKLKQIVYIGRQETLEADWRQIKTLLSLPPDVELPSDPAVAHLGRPRDDTSLDTAARDALHRWYKRDFKLLELCEKIRTERGWGIGPNELRHADEPPKERTAAAGFDVARYRAPRDNVGR
jgi:Sulfotransferase family